MRSLTLCKLSLLLLENSTRPTPERRGMSHPMQANTQPGMAGSKVLRRLALISNRDAYLPGTRLKLHYSISYPHNKRVRERLTTPKLDFPGSFMTCSRSDSYQGTESAKLQPVSLPHRQLSKGESLTLSLRPWSSRCS